MKKLLLLTNDHIKFETNSISSDFNDTINIIQAISKNNFLYFFCRKKNESGIFKTSLKKKFKLKLLDILAKKNLIQLHFNSLLLQMRINSQRMPDLF